MPRKTLTALEPVTLPTELSAVSSPMAATLEANVSRGVSEEGEYLYHCCIIGAIWGEGAEVAECCWLLSTINFIAKFLFLLPHLAATKTA